MTKISAELNELVMEALDLGFGCFCDGDRVPFAMIDDHDKRHLIDFHSADGTIDQSIIATARETVAQTFPDAHRYALVWDGYLTTDGVKQDAVFAEAGEPGMKDAIIFAQAYREKKRPKVLEKIGDPLAVQFTRNLFKVSKRTK